MTSPFTFDNSYARLPDRFFARLAPTPVAAPVTVAVNRALARDLGVDPLLLDGEAGAAMLAGNVVPEGAEPLAMAYAGHQFGQFVPQLGDGRAILLGEVSDRAGQRRDIQLKGAGRTPFSRGGDGRAALGPVLREYLMGEAMHALGIPTTRALAAVSTGEPVHRETALPGAVLTRVALSHVRVGTFQFFAARGDTEALTRLVAYVIDRHYPELEGSEQPALDLLAAVAARQARLVAMWLSVGFIHGVMNTDNMSIAGETIDYGPCAFMDTYDPATVFSSIDEAGRYAFANQPRLAGWNLARLAEALLGLIDPDVERAVTRATEAVEVFGRTFESELLQRMGRKVGLEAAGKDDLALVHGLLEVMHKGAADYTLTFRGLADAAVDADADDRVAGLFATPEPYREWAAGWRARLAREGTRPAAQAALMRRVNPAIIPRNHRVEQALEAAVERGDLQPFGELLEALGRPYDDPPDRLAKYMKPPRPEERVLATFCGT